MNKKLSVSAGILVYKEGDSQRRICMARRASDQSHPGSWEFPGGKVETGETFVQALHREIFEELNITIFNPTKIHETIIKKNTESLHIVFFKAECHQVAQVSKVHDQIHWFSIEELKQFYANTDPGKILEADIPVLKMIINGFLIATS